MHELGIRSVEDHHDGKQRDYSMRSGKVTAHFKNLESHLCQYIAKADVVIGCVAWLTHQRIVNALSKKECSIVIQKEDLWRPDLGESGNSSKKRHRDLYAKLKCSLYRYSLPGVASELSVCGDAQVEPLRCVGNYNSDKKPAFPRAHHKFVVFCKLVPRKLENTDLNTFPEVVPYAVWTGSFNFTKNAAQSFENAVYIDDPEIAEAYANEYAQVFALSEPLNWNSNWSAPEFRIGT